MSIPQVIYRVAARERREHVSDWVGRLAGTSVLVNESMWLLAAATVSALYWLKPEVFGSLTPAAIVAVLCVLPFAIISESATALLILIGKLRFANMVQLAGGLLGVGIVAVAVVALRVGPAVAREVLSLPMWPQMTADQVEKVVRGNQS